MSEHEKSEVNEMSSKGTTKYLATKETYVSRREALKKTGSMVAGAGIIFLGLGLPVVKQKQGFAAGGPGGKRCFLTCTGDCDGCKGCSGCSGCKGCTGTTTIVCEGGEAMEGCDACDVTCATTCGDACSTSSANKAKKK